MSTHVTTMVPRGSVTLEAWDGERSLEVMTSRTLFHSKVCFVREIVSLQLTELFGPVTVIKC